MCAAQYQSVALTCIHIHTYAYAITQTHTRTPVPHTPLLHYLAMMHTDPLSSYPSAILLNKLQVAQWRELGAHLGLSDDQLEDAEKSPQPTAAVLLAAKVRDINLRWNKIAESLLRVGEYDLAESICNKQGKLAPWCVNSAAPLIGPEPVRLALEISTSLGMGKDHYSIN